MISDQQLRNQIDQIFNKYDNDFSGSLNSNQMANFFNDLFQQIGQPTRINNQQAQEAIKKIDQNNDGKVSKIEIFNAMKYMMNNQAQYGGNQQNTNKYEVLRVKLDTVFARHDRDKSGYLTQAEFPAFFTELCKELNVQAPTDWNSVNQIAKQMDVNYDGKVSKTEAFNLFRKVLNY